MTRRQPGRNGRSRGWLAAGLAVVTSVAGVGGAEAATAPHRTTPAAVAVPALSWTDCGSAAPGRQCATATVPLDHRRPDGPTIDIVMIRIPATDPDRRIGSLFVNPGGPGASGWDTVRNAGAAFAPFAQRFDIVGFDPRGVARSSPVTCWDSHTYQQRFTAAGTGPGAAGRAIADGRDFARACAADAAALVPYLGSGYVARDLDLMRAAVGDDRLTYLGLSFGTYLGTVYANLFPRRVRALALDGAYDPDQYANGGPAQDRPQFEAADAALTRFFAWCTATPTRCSFGGGDPAGAFIRLLRRLDREPVTTTGADGTTATANGVTLAYQVLFGLNFGRAAWPQLATALLRADQDSSGPLLSAGAPNVTLFNANVAVECTDRAYPRSGLARILAGHVAAAPLLGPAVAYGPPAYDHSHGAACAQWTLPRPSRYAGPFDADGAAPILVVGTTGDPDTPYRDAVALSRRLADARLVTFDAEGHTAFRRSACVRDATLAYVVDLVLPEPGHTCSDEAVPAS